MIYEELSIDLFVFRKMNGFCKFSLNRKVRDSKNNVKNISEVYYSFIKNTIDINFDVNIF